MSKRSELSLVTSFPDPETGLIAINIIVDGYQEVRLVASPAHIASAIEMMAKALARVAKV
jgi:hypothetical protein